MLVMLAATFPTAAMAQEIPSHAAAHAEQGRSSDDSHLCLNFVDR